MLLPQTWGSPVAATRPATGRTPLPRWDGGTAPRRGNTASRGPEFGEPGHVRPRGRLEAGTGSTGCLGRRDTGEGEAGPACGMGTATRSRGGDRGRTRCSAAPPARLPRPLGTCGGSSQFCQPANWCAASGTHDCRLLKGISSLFSPLTGVLSIGDYVLPTSTCFGFPARRARRTKLLRGARGVQAGRRPEPRDRIRKLGLRAAPCHVFVGVGAVAETVWASLGHFVTDFHRLSARAGAGGNWGGARGWPVPGWGGGGAPARGPDPPHPRGPPRGGGPRVLPRPRCCWGWGTAQVPGPRHTQGAAQGVGRGGLSEGTGHKGAFLRKLDPGPHLAQKCRGVAAPLFPGADVLDGKPDGKWTKYMYDVGEH